MANTILLPTHIVKEGLVVLENNLVAGSWVNKQYSPQFAVNGAKKGDSVQVRVPPRFIVSDGAAFVESNVDEGSVTVQLNHQFHVGVKFGQRELLLDMNDFSKQVLEPVISSIANKIDALVLAEAREFYNSVGTPGTIPADLDVYLSAGVKLSNGAVPREGLAVFLTPQMEATLVFALRGLFQQSNAIADQYIKGQMGRAAGFLFYMDQNCSTHTVGPLGGTPLVNGASQTGTSLITDAWTSAAANRLLRGDIFTIDNVQSVNPQNRESTGQLQQFVVTQDADSDGSGNLTVLIQPPMIATGKDQTINALAANNAAINVLGAANTITKQGLALHRDAITLATADLPTIKNAEMYARQSDDQLGISMALWSDSNIDTYDRKTRLDVLCGAKTIRREMGVRIASGA